MAKKEMEEISWIETDIVVVGLGIAGLCAAIRASELKAKVLAIDKLERFDDPSKIFSELPGGPGNATLKAGTANHFSEREFKQKLETFMDESWGRGNLEQFKEIVRVGPYVFNEWLIKHGNMAGGTVKEETMSPDGRPYRARYTCKWLYPAAEKLGAKFLFKTKLTKLLTDSKSKRVVGVRVLTSDGPKDVKAKAVIVATGGFEGSEAMKLQCLCRF